MPEELHFESIQQRIAKLEQELISIERELISIDKSLINELEVYDQASNRLESRMGGNPSADRALSGR